MTHDPGCPATNRLGLLRDDAARLGLPLDAAAWERFEAYLDLLLEWNERASLTAVIEPEQVQRRHFGESLALLAALRSPDSAGADAPLAPGVEAHIADLGTGGGFPGLPLRIAEPTIRLTLIEAQARRCAFLERVVEALDLPDVTVVQARAEDAGRDEGLRASFDLVTARALAAMPVLVEYALPLLRRGGVLAAPKGSRADDELVAAAPAIAALGGIALPSRPLPLPAGAPPQRVLLVRRDGALDDRYPRRAGIPSKRPIGSASA